MLKAHLCDPATIVGYKTLTSFVRATNRSDTIFLRCRDLLSRMRNLENGRTGPTQYATCALPEGCEWTHNLDILTPEGTILSVRGESGPHKLREILRIARWKGLAASRATLKGIEHGIDTERTNKLWRSLEGRLPLAAFQLRRILCGGVEYVHREATRKAGYLPSSEARPRSSTESASFSEGSGKDESSSDYASWEESSTCSTSTSSWDTPNSGPESFSPAHSSSSSRREPPLPPKPPSRCRACGAETSDESHTHHILWECQATSTIDRQPPLGNLPPCLKFHGILPLNLQGDILPIQNFLLQRVQRYDLEVTKSIQTALSSHPWAVPQPMAVHIGPPATKLISFGQRDFSLLASIIEWASRLKWHIGPGQVSFIELAIDFEASTQVILKSKKKRRPQFAIRR